MGCFQPMSKHKRAFTTRWRETITNTGKTFHLVGVFENLKIANMHKRRLKCSGRDVRLLGRGMGWYRPHPITGKKGRYAVYCWPKFSLKEKELEGF